MKRSLIVFMNIAVMAFILFFIFRYSNAKMEENKQSALESYQNMTITAEQIIENYLEDEQHLCDIWSNYVNRSAEAGTPMTAEEAINYIRKAKLYPSIHGHLIDVEDPQKNGISTSPKSTDPDDYSVSYRNIKIFDNLDAVSRKDGDVNLTRAFTNPMSGVQSIAFLNYVTVLEEETGNLRKYVLMRVEPVSILEEKLVFLKGEYENVEAALIDKDGNYVVHGKSFKNSNFYEYYKSYNGVSSVEHNDLIQKIMDGTGQMTMKNYKGETCVISYTPLSSIEDWALLTYIPAKDLETDRAVDWMLLGVVGAGLLFLLFHNIMILVKYNRQLAETAEAANQANKAKSYFLSTMSHDIRTPMNAILGLNEMVLRESSEPAIVKYSESIRTAGNTLLGLINDILDFSKIEAGRMDLVPVDYNFVSMLNDLVNMVQKKAEDKGLQFRLDVDRDIPMILHGDEIRIKQIITNILSNAVKYTKEGSVTFHAGFERIEGKDEIRLKISVEDTGIGIKEEDLAKLFVAFERIEEKRNRNIEGTGLGMTIAQSFLDMMGSNLEVKSEYGKGSVFSFELLQEVKKWQPIGNYEETFKRCVEERRRYHEKFTAPHAHVLVVDDTPVNLTVFQSLLTRTKIQIDTAESGDECISLFQRKHYDIIFLDHMMPDKDGIETLAELKTLSDTPNEKTPIVCLTANAISGMREMYIKAGFDDYLTKPIDPERLENILIEYLPKGKIAPASPGDEAEDDYAIPDFIFKIDRLDVNSGLTHCGSREAYMSTVRMYLDSAEKNGKEIEEYWAAKDLKNTTVKVHALKSTSRVIGALHLGDFAARLEKAGDAGDMETLERELPALLREYRELAEKLSPLLEENGDPSEDTRPLISIESLHEAFDALSEFCAAFDFDSVVHVVESLDQYRIPEEEATRYDLIKKAVDNFDYDLIPGIITGEENT